MRRACALGSPAGLKVRKKAGQKNKKTASTFPFANNITAADITRSYQRKYISAKNADHLTLKGPPDVQWTQKKNTI